MKISRKERFFSTLLVTVAAILVTAVLVTWALKPASNQFPHETPDDSSSFTSQTTSSSPTTSTPTESQESETTTVAPTTEATQSSIKSTTASSSKSSARKPKIKNAVALTFDDGPTKHTARLLDALKKHNAKATFFLLGKNVAGNKALIQRMIDEGHEVANHSYSHPDLRNLSDAEVLSQLRKTNDAIAAITGEKPKLMRPPYGAFNRRVTGLAKQEGLALICWTPSPNDWKYQDVDYVYNYILKHVKAGSTLLLHDTYKTSVDAVIKAIPVLAKRGLTFVTVSELYDLEPGDVHPASWAR